MCYMRICFLLVCFCSLNISAMGQEQEADDYSDYSYLWEESENNKSKKKKKKSSDQIEIDDSKINSLDDISDKASQLSIVSSDTLKEGDTAELLEEGVIDESIIIETIPSDTLKNIKSLELPATDSLDIQEENPLVVPNDSTANEEKEKIENEDVNIEPSDDKLDTEKVEKDFHAEDFRAPMGSVTNGGSFNGGFTMTVIDDQYYAGLTLQPEFSIGKVGVGLNVPILYGLEDKKIRTEMFKDGVGVARLITYIRYGVQKRDPVYVKVGQLDNTMIGFGGLINNYTNTTSFEKRKLGLHYDVNFKSLFGIEGMYSDFNMSSFNLFAIRPYVRPLSRMSIPIIKTTEIGVTFIKDSDQTETGSRQYSLTKDGIGAFGLDMGITLLNVPFIQIDFFANYSRLNTASQALTDTLTVLYDTNTQPDALNNGFEDGSGASVGLNFRFHFIANILSTDIRLERLNYSEHYLPQFFNTTYELNKDARILALANVNKTAGIYGSLKGHILQKITIGGSLMIPDDISEESPAFVEVNANMERLADKITLQGSYFKGNLSDLGDAFSFDENSLAKVRVMYHLNKWMAAGVDYYWAFTPTENNGFEATKYISPYFGLSINF